MATRLMPHSVFRYRLLTELVMPRLLELHGHLAEVAHAQATVARLWELARSKRMENERIAGPPRGPGEGPCPRGENEDMPLTNLSESFKSFEVLFAADRSAAEGRAVTIAEIRGQ